MDHLTFHVPVIFSANSCCLKIMVLFSSTVYYWIVKWTDVLCQIRSNHQNQFHLRWWVLWMMMALCRFSCCHRTTWDGRFSQWALSVPYINKHAYWIHCIPYALLSMIEVIFWYSSQYRMWTVYFSINIYIYAYLHWYFFLFMTMTQTCHVSWVGFIHLTDT